FLCFIAFKIRLWKFSMTDNKLYCINCIGSVNIPTSRESCEVSLRRLVNLMWFLKENMEETNQVLEQLKASHTNNMKAIARKRSGYQELKTLDVYFKENTHIILHEKIIKNSELLYMNSF
ncbi:uncharacterized protein B0P05DRAFT_472235, partial [Gilbertella persicaria]|uniref:uncharacterized protein n=1 Tax=Gilbertella persicaria TaxID=101096 RepID=UPI00221F0C81